MKEDRTENLSISDKEKIVLDFWKKEQIFQKSLDNRIGCTLFSFYDGPPFATGLPHYGHFLAGTIKDVIPRYKTMKGFYVGRRFGWDCHGLPVEHEVEKKFGISGIDAVNSFGLANFNEECRSIVFRYADAWKLKVERMGRWVDFDKTWKTMDLSFMESVWCIFNKLHKQGLVYEGFKVTPYSPKLGTPLSNFEAGSHYKEVRDHSIVVEFPLKEDENTVLLIWTTTPWTLISNMAVTVGPGIDYVKVKIAQSDKTYIVAERLVAQWFKDVEYLIEGKLTSKDLVNKEYLPPFDYFIQERENGAFKIIEDSFVTTDGGTGLVHTAPAFGEADFYACKNNGIPIVCPINESCLFNDEIEEYKGLFVKDADLEIIKRLKSLDKLFFKGKILHRYPYCWRTDFPLIYKAVSTLYIAVEKIKDVMIQTTSEINWVPGNIKEGRFGKWIQGARDWAVSRNRFWGTPIPIWKSEDGDVCVIGSIAELEEKAKVKITDLHRHFIDDITFEINGKLYRRIKEVFDCWFDAGSMPYASIHYPFESTEEFDSIFPADFIAEGIDQTRGWFYTLNVLSAACFGKPAFKNAVVNGIVLAEDGNKMSKRLKNYPDPDIVVEAYGADAVRLYMVGSAVVKGEDLKFSEKGVELIVRQIIMPLKNALTFFKTYSEIYNIDYSSLSESKEKAEHVMDEWIIDQVSRFVDSVESSLESYDLMKPVEAIEKICDDLTNWYIRRSRRRFWASVDSPDRASAFRTLYQSLIRISKVIAPFAPFISEEIYQQLKTTEDKLSVHICDFPVIEKDSFNNYLFYGMEALRKVVNTGHALRKEQRLKVRQPLSNLYLCCNREQKILDFLSEYQELILDELNVKSVSFLESEGDFVTLSLKPNFKVLGKKVGKHMGAVKNLLTDLSENQVKSLLMNGSISIEVEDSSFIITKEDVEIVRQVKDGYISESKDDIAIVLDTTITKPLQLEGIAREIINKINTLRKALKFDIIDRIKVKILSNEEVKNALDEYASCISEEVLSIDTSFELLEDDSDSNIIDLNGNKAILEIEKASV